MPVLLTPTTFSSLSSFEQKNNPSHSVCFTNKPPCHPDWLFFGKPASGSSFHRMHVQNPAILLASVAPPHSGAIRTICSFWYVHGIHDVLSTLESQNVETRCPEEDEDLASEESVALFRVHYQLVSDKPLRTNNIVPVRANHWHKLESTDPCAMRSAHAAGHVSMFARLLVSGHVSKVGSSSHTQRCIHGKVMESVFTASEAKPLKLSCSRFPVPSSRL